MFDCGLPVCYNLQMKNLVENLYAVIIAGGSGERFWPRSRAGSPKQFLPIVGKKSMLEVTFSRIKPLIPAERIFVCTGAEFKKKVAELLPGMPDENIISEPCSRNTAAAAGLSAVSVGRVDKSAVMAVLPADHLIDGEDLFRDALASAARAASDLGSLVVFGVEPDRPATGYGYIKAGERVDGSENLFRVENFFEKPDSSTAEKFCRSGLCSWNSGMFVWTYSAVMDEIRKHMPRLHEGLLRIESDPGAIGEVYSSLPAVSVDHGVMEKTSNAVMMRVCFGWNDIGSWDALEAAVEKDLNGNVVMAENFRGLDSSDNVIVSDGTLVAAIGIKNLVIVVEGGAVLVCRKDRAQDVKKMVSELKKDGKLKKFA